jgi:hypothetical protein
MDRLLTQFKKLLEPSFVSVQYLLELPDDVLQLVGYRALAAIDSAANATSLDALETLDDRLCKLFGPEFVDMASTLTSNPDHKQAETDPVPSHPLPVPSVLAGSLQQRLASLSLELRRLDAAMHATHSDTSLRESNELTSAILHHQQTHPGMVYTLLAIGIERKSARVS